MRVAGIHITNLMGIEELEISPGLVTVVEGRNGAGKSSVIEAIRAALGGGSDATLIRNGEDEGSVVLILDDGTEVWRRQRGDKGETTVRDPKRGSLSAPVTYLRSLLGPAPLDPAKFLTMSAREQVDLLLKLCPATVTADEVQAAVGDLLEFSTITGEVNAVVGIERARKELYERRTGINGAAEEKLGALNQLKTTLPDDADIIDPSQRIAELQHLLTENEQDMANAAARTSSETNQIIRESAARRDEALVVVEEECAFTRSTLENLLKSYQEMVDSVKEELRELKAEELRRKEAERARLVESTNQELIDLEKQYDEQRAAIYARRTELASELSALQERQRTYDQTTKTLEILDQMSVQHAELVKESKCHTDALTALGELKRVVLGRSFDVAGLDVRDDGIFVDGVPFGRLNTARRVEIAIELAKLGAGELGFICIDNLECLDSETIEAFNQRQARGDVQILYARVTDTPLTISTVTAAGEVESPAETFTMNQ